MRTKLQLRLDSGAVHLWEPQIPGDPHLRTLFITDEIYQEFDEDTWNESQLAYRYATLATDFDRFVTGDMIPVGMKPYEKGENAFMAKIDPVEYGIWTIRSVAPKPAIRVFGAFCEKDTFIALLTRLRRNLGGPGSREWANAREDAIRRWENLFPDQERLLGDNLNDFFTEKAIIV